MVKRIAILVLVCLTPSLLWAQGTQHDRILARGQSTFDSLRNSQTIVIAGSTPAVGLGNVFKTNNPGSVTITNFVGGGDSQQIAIVCGDVNTVISNNSNITTTGAANQQCAVGVVFSFIFDAGTTKWVQSGTAGGGGGGSCSGTCVQTNQSNSYSAGTQSFASSVDLVAPKAANFVPPDIGGFGFDTTNGVYVGKGAATKYFTTLANLSATSGHCIESLGNALLADAGPCAAGSTGALQYNNAGFPGGSGLVWSPTTLFSYNAGTLTTDLNPFNLNFTLNNASQVFNGVVWNFTNTAYAAGSFDLQFCVDAGKCLSLSPLGGLSAPNQVGSGDGSAGGNVEMGQGPLPAILPNSVGWFAPTSVDPLGFLISLPGTPCSGLLNLVATGHYATSSCATAGGTGTVTNTPGSLGANQLLLGNGGADVKALGSTGLTGQPLVATNGGAAGFVSPGTPGRVVLIASDTVQCDSGTALRDRKNMIEYAASSLTTVTLPQAGSSGCGGNFAFTVAVLGTGANIVPTSPSTITICTGALCSNPSSSLSLATGNYCTINSPDNANYVALCSIRTPLPTSVALLGTDSSATIVSASAHNASTPLLCITASGSGTAYACSTTPSFTPALGDTIHVIIDTLSGVNATLNINFTSNAPIKKGGGGANITAGDFLVGQIVEMFFDGTNWQANCLTSSGSLSGLTTNNLSKATSSSSVGDSGIADDGATISSSELLSFSPTAAASTPAYNFGGTFFTGGTGTTTKPHFYLNLATTQPTTWNTLGTAFGINAPTGCGRAFDIHVNGGASAFSVDCSGGMSVGSVVSSASVSSAAGSAVGMNNRSRFFAGADGRVNWTNFAIQTNSITRYTFGTEAANNPAFVFDGSTSVIKTADGLGATTAGIFSSAIYNTDTNCSGVGTSASPSVVTCGAAAAGAFSCATAATGATCTINTTAAHTNSDIVITQTASANARLGVTCNTTADAPTGPRLASISNNVNFTINLGTLANPGCYIFHIVN